MKPTRVLLASTNNPLYFQFWNPISRIYKENFGINPTLIFIGTDKEMDACGLSTDYGDIIVKSPHPKFHAGWQAAWAIFYFMGLYPDDTFCTMGIDQVPLSPLLLRDVPADTYMMLADDAYFPSTWENAGGTSPTSFHLCSGATANKVYRFENAFHWEIEKLAKSGIKPYYDNGETKWGLDESYSSEKLRQFRNQGGKVAACKSFGFICERRIECCREKETPYDDEKLKSGWYGDAHFCRPYDQHKEYIDKILSLIPK